MGKRVLVVDDDKIIVVTVKKLLQDHGFEVLCAYSGEEALSLLDAGEWADVILMDIDFGDNALDGTEATRRINERYDIPVIFHSGHTDRETIDKTKAFTRHGYVHKVERNESFLLATVEMALSLHKAEQRLQESENKYRELFNNIDCGVIVSESDDEGGHFTIADLNIGAEHFFEGGRRALIGASLSDVWKESDGNGLMDVFRRIYRRGGAESFPVERYRGEELVEYLQTYIYKLESGEIVGVFRDLTPRLRAEQERDRVSRKNEDLLNERMQEKALLASIVESSEDAIISLDLQGTVVSWNRGAEKIYGYASSEMRGRPVFPLEAEENRGQIRSLLSRIAGGEQIRHFEAHRVRKDRSLITLSISYSPVRDDSGTIIGVSTIGRDITRLKKLEQEVEASSETILERNYAIESSISPIAFSDLRGRLTYVNTAFCRLWGYKDSAEIIGRPVGEFLADPESLEEVVTAVTENGMWSGDLTGRKKNGSDFDVHLNTNIVKNSRGEVISVMASFVDLSERNVLQKALIENERRMNTILSAMAEGIVVVNTAGQISYANESASKILCIKKEEIEQRYYQSREWGQIDNEGMELPREKLPLSIAMRNRTPVYAVEHGLRDAGSGEERWLSVSAVPLINAEGILQGAVASFRDISRQKQNEQELQRLLNIKETLMKEIEHRIKNNLAMLIAIMNLEKRKIRNEQAAAVLDDMQGRITAFIQLYMRSYGLGEIGTVNINAYLRELSNAIIRMNSAAMRRIRVRTEIDEFHIPTRTAGILGLITAELLMNCVKYAFGKTKAIIHVLIAFAPVFDGKGANEEGIGSRYQQYVLTIADDGVALPEDFSLDRNDSIGLNIVKLLSEDLEGVLFLEKRKGYTKAFSVSFPLPIGSVLEK